MTTTRGIPRHDFVPQPPPHDGYCAVCCYLRSSWHTPDLRCQHGNASGACRECANGIDPTTGDAA